MAGKRHSVREITEVIDALNSGLSASEASKKYKVTLQTIYRWKRMAYDKSNSATKGTDRMSPTRGVKTLSLAELRQENIRLRLFIADLLLKREDVA